MVAILGAALGLWQLSRPSIAPSAPSAPSAASSDILQVRSTDWTMGGGQTARVILIEYLDFECEACGAYAPVVKQLQGEFGDDLRLVARYFPLPGHKNSLQAALAAEAAGQQGKFWEMHDVLFETQKEWAERPAEDPGLFLPYARKIGLDVAKFERDRADPTVRARVERDRQESQELGNSGTPSFFVNGKRIDNPRSIDAFRALLEKARQ